MRSMSACCVALGLALASQNASAEPPTSLRIVGDADACPSPTQLMKQLQGLLPQTKLRVVTDGATAQDATVVDGGTTFSVSVAGQTRDFTDEERHCSDRARLGAVFVALVLDPLKFPEEQPPDSTLPPADSEEPSGTDAPSTSPEATPPPRTPEESAETDASPDAPPDSDSSRVPWVRTGLDFEVGPAFQFAPGADSSNVPLLGGAGLRLRWGAALSLSLGAAAFLPATLSYEGGGARVLWVPVDISGRVQGRSGNWEGGAELGPVAAMLRVQGQSVADAQSASRIDVGLRAAAIGRYWAGSRNALFMALHCAVFPRPYALEVEGLGPIGTTPAVWVGASVGMVVRAY